MTHYNNNNILQFPKNKSKIWKLATNYAKLALSKQFIVLKQFEAEIPNQLKFQVRFCANQLIKEYNERKELPPNDPPDCA